MTAVLSHTGTAVTLLGGALLATAAGILRDRQNAGRQNAGRQNGLTQNGHEQNGHQQTAGKADVEHWLWLVTAGSFAGVGLLISALAADWVTGAAVLVLSAVCFTASHIEELPVLYPPAVVAALGGSVALAAEAYQDVPGVWDGFLPWLTGAGMASAALYTVRLMRSGPLQADPVRRWSLAGAAFLGLVLVAFVGIRHDATSWTAAAGLAAAVGVSYREAPARARRIALEVGALLLTVAIQRAAIFELDAPEDRTGRLLTDLPSPFWVVQWYVVLAAVLGGLRYFAGNQAAGRFLVGAASVLLSLSGLGIVFGGNAGQQLWVLVLFALLLTAGLGLGNGSSSGGARRGGRLHSVGHAAVHVPAVGVHRCGADRLCRLAAEPWNGRSGAGGGTRGDPGLSPARRPATAGTVPRALILLQTARGVHHGMADFSDHRGRRGRRSFLGQEAFPHRD
ncbi:conserved hypothetical protein [Arthrobacter sp. Hiyo4]|nr:conserved hypothetical protein [Arthrobacter sp. Hiyo4]